MKRMMGLVLACMLLSMPLGFAATTSTGIGISITPGNIVPQIWQDTSQRQLLNVFGTPLTRMNNYAFEGEQIQWEVYVRDSNGVEDIGSVDVTVGSIAGLGNPVEVSCTYTSHGWTPTGISYNSNTDKCYSCLLTVEPQSSMSGQYWMQAVVTDDQGAQDSVREDSFFWFNPSIGLQVLDAPSGLVFGSVSPGSTGYSQTIRLRSIVASGSGVILDVDVLGTDFYDPSSSGAMCPTTNQLELSNFRYYATKGSHDTSGSTNPAPDGEGYLPIGYIQKNIMGNLGVPASQLTEGSEFAITFKLNLPLPCSGNFVVGAINFVGEAI